jgi:hypothetical protein
MTARIKPFLFFAAALIFLVLTAPVNHSEAEDAYYYSRMAGQGAWSEMFHSHHLLYLPLVRTVFRGLQLSGYAGGALPVLIGVSMVSGALAVCLFAALLRRAGAKERIARFFAAALLFSYGFWRYSTTAEIYAHATMLALLTVYCAVRSEEHPLFFGGSVLSGAAALLIHLVTLPAVLLAVPFLYFARRSWRRAVVYSALTVLIASAVYFSAARTAGLVIFTDKEVVRDSLLAPRVWLKGASAAGHNLLSANFLFALPDASQKIESLFPAQMLQEEAFMGRQAPVWVRWLAPVTLGAVASLLVALLFFSLRNCRKGLSGSRGVAGAVLLWLGGSSAMAFLFEPANPEMWICALTPFWLSLGLIWRAAPEGRIARWLPVALAAGLLIHNGVGGISLVKSPEGDYCRQKAAWVVGQARPGDLIVSADSHSFITFLEYQTPARVLDAKFADLKQRDDAQQQTEGRIFVFGDVLEPLPPVRARLSTSVQRLRNFGETLKPDLLMIHQDRFGTVYQWKKP